MINEGQILDLSYNSRIQNVDIISYGVRVLSVASVQNLDIVSCVPCVQHLAIVAYSRYLVYNKHRVQYVISFRLLLLRST